MATAYTINDRIGRLALTVIVKNAADAQRAAKIGCDPTLAPYRVVHCPMSVARESIDYWRNNFTTDKAVDLTNNEGWNEL